jgi:hypothetical protein
MRCGHDGAVASGQQHRDAIGDLNDAHTILAAGEGGIRDAGHRIAIEIRNLGSMDLLQPGRLDWQA